MTTTITVTSKRQLTIPKKIWQQLDLEGVRYLQAEVENGNLKLQKVNFNSQLNNFWNKTSKAVRGQLDDASIMQASRDSHSHKSII